MYILKIADVSVLDAIEEIIRYFLISLVFCLPLIIAKYYSQTNIFLIIIGIVTSVLYYGVIILMDVQLKQGLINSLKNFSQK